MTDPDDRPSALLKVLAAVIAVSVVAVWCERVSVPYEEPASHIGTVDLSKSAALPTPEPEPKDDTWIKDRAQLDLIGKTLIEDFDRPCPRVAMARHKLPSDRGNRMKVWCGPESGGVYDEWIYMITGTPGGRVFVETAGILE